MAPWLLTRSELIDPHSFPRRNDTLSISDVGHLHELDEAGPFRWEGQAHGLHDALHTGLDQFPLFGIEL